MEEEIRVLEENINNGIIYCGCGYTTEKAIEHLISAYKKSEEENKELKSDLKYVLEQTLGAFVDNWCIDWNFTEIREKYGLEERNK